LPKPPPVEEKPKEDGDKKAENKNTEKEAKEPSDEKVSRNRWYSLFYRLNCVILILMDIDLVLSILVKMCLIKNVLQGDGKKEGEKEPEDK